MLAVTAAAVAAAELFPPPLAPLPLDELVRLFSDPADADDDEDDDDEPPVVDPDDIMCG